MSAAFTDGFELCIGGQTVGLEQTTAEPGFADPITLDGGVLTAHFAAKAVYDFERDEAAALALGMGEPTAALRAHRRRTDAVVAARSGPTIDGLVSINLRVQ